MCKNKAEKKEFKELYEKIDDEVLKNRIKTSGEWYIDHAVKYRRYFKILSYISIITPLLLTAITTLGGMSGRMDDFQVKAAMVVLSLLTSLSTSLLSFTRSLDKWTLYRRTIESMKRELALYWKGKTKEDDLRVLVEKLEKIMEAENDTWCEISKDMGSQQDGKNHAGDGSHNKDETEHTPDKGGIAGLATSGTSSMDEK